MVICCRDYSVERVSVFVDAENEWISISGALDSSHFESIPVLTLYKAWLTAASVSALFFLCIVVLHLPTGPHPRVASSGRLCRSWSESLLQSRGSLPLNTPLFPWKATLSPCSATWPAPTVPTRRASGWKMARRSQKHAALIRTQSTGIQLVCVCVCVR